MPETLLRITAMATIVHQLPAFAEEYARPAALAASPATKTTFAPMAIACPVAMAAGLVPLAGPAPGRPAGETREPAKVIISLSETDVLPPQFPAGQMKPVKAANVLALAVRPAPAEIAALTPAEITAVRVHPAGPVPAVSVWPALGAETVCVTEAKLAPPALLTAIAAQIAPVPRREFWTI